MALFQFACPYCSGPFAVENPPAGQAIACPSCGASVALPAELPVPADSLPPVAELPPPAAEPPQQLPAPQATDESAAASDPLEFLALPQPPTSGTRRRSSRSMPAPVRRLSRGEKERRRLIRSLVLLAAGLIVLSIAVVVLSRF